MSTVQEQTREESKQQAFTMLQQLGGNKFIAMTGAKVSFDSDGTLFCWFKGSKKANMLKISLDYATDTYIMEFSKLGYAPKFTVKPVKKLTMVYAEDLQSFFTDVTGLYTSLS